MVDDSWYIMTDNPTEITEANFGVLPKEPTWFHSNSDGGKKSTSAPQQAAPVAQQAAAKAAKAAKKPGGGRFEVPTGAYFNNPRGGWDQRLRIENNRTPWTSSYADNAEVTIVLKNGEGGFVADDATLDRLEGEGRVVDRYLVDNPNGSLRDIAGITNERGNVVGLMPHPEHAVEDLTGAGTDGLGFFTSLAAATFA